MKRPGRSPDRIASRLRSFLGGAAVVSEELSVRRLYARDLAELPRFLERAFLRSVPDLVVQPRSPDAVLSLVRFAVAEGIPLVPRGAGSSGFGGSVPARGGITVDLSSMDQIESVDPGTRTATVLAGAKWDDVDRRAGHRGLALATCPSSRFSTVAGWVATGGYGMDSFRHGHLSEHVRWIEVATPARGGELVRVRPGDPDYLFYSGTEGQFGIVTRVELSLVEKPERFRAFFLLFEDPDSALRFAGELAAGNVPARHAVFLDAGHQHETNAVRRAARPGADAVVPEKDGVLVYFSEERGDDLAAAARFEESLGPRLERHRGRAAARHVANLVFHDRFLPLKAKKLGPRILGAQVVLPIEGVADYLGRARRICARFGVPFSSETHLVRTPQGMRGLVMAILPVDWRGAPGHLAHLSLAALLTWTGIRRGGKPYSIGVWNSPYTRLKWGKDLPRLVEAKRATDPGGVMNPGKFPIVRSRFLGLPALLFRPAPYGLAMRAASIFSRLVGWLRLGRLLGRVDAGSIDPARPLSRSTAECTYCGACQPVCPAWLVTRDERVVARSKLQVGARLLAGDSIDPEEARMAFVCLHCGECTRVCQAILPLVPVWDELEVELERRFGFPKETVDSFLAELPQNAAFQERVLLHEPTLYESLSETRRRIELPLARRDLGSRTP